MVLDGNSFAREQGGKVFSVLGELLMLQNLSSCQGRGTLVRSYSPFGAGRELAWLYREEVSQYPPE